MEKPRLSLKLVRAITVTAFASGWLVSCSVTGPPATSRKHPTWQHIPGWAQTRVQNPWWQTYGDAVLNKRIARAFSGNPDLAVIAARLERSEAVLKRAGAAMKPQLNLGVGWRDGREREADFGPYELSPWQGSGQFSWELDVTGKLLAATRSARYSRDAAFWDVHAARLQLASRIASIHFLLNQLHGDIAIMRELNGASKRLVTISKSQADAGIVTTTVYREQQAQHEQALRNLQELERLRGMAGIQLSTLLGDTPSRTAGSSSRLPYPRDIGHISVQQLLVSHPTVLASEARVRSAFQLEKSAKLNLLPSFRVNTSVAGAGNSLTGPYKIWRHQVGPSLDIPVYDPTRIAQTKVRAAERKEASANYQATVLKALGEIESARLNFSNRKKQFTSAERELAALRRAYNDTQSRFSAGTVAEDAPLKAKQRLLMAQIGKRRVQQSLLNDHISLMKAIGGK